MENYSDTIKINIPFKGMIGHRGCAGLETENTLKAFNEGGRRTYFGLECDIQSTKDKILIVSHDETLNRIGHVDMRINEHTFEEIEKISFIDKRTGLIDKDMHAPLFSDYLKVCKKYHKKAIVELKETLENSDIIEAIKEVKNEGMESEVIYISFYPGYLAKVRELCPKAHLQFLTQVYEPSILELCIAFHMGIDADYRVMTKEIIDVYHNNGLDVNVYTVNDVETAKKLIESGIDNITTNILE